jgi:hypothetical protein
VPRYMHNAQTSTCARQSPPPPAEDMRAAASFIGPPVA